MNCIRIGIIVLTLSLLLAANVGLGVTSSMNLTASTQFDKQPISKPISIDKVVVQKVKVENKATGKTEVRWRILVGRKPSEEGRFKPKYVVVEPNEGYYIVFSDRERGEVNSTAVVNVVALNNGGPVSNAHAVLQICNYDCSRCYNYSIITNSQGLGRVTVRLNESGIRLINYTNIASETNIYYLSNYFDLERVALIDVTAQGEPKPYIVTGNETKNVTLKIFGIDFNGTPISQELHVIITLYPGGTVLYDDIATPVNGVATVTIQIPHNNSIRTLYININTANNDYNLASIDMKVAPGVVNLIALTTLYFRYNSTNLVIPLMVVDRHREIVKSGELHYEICVYNATTWSCANPSNTSITNGFAYVNVNLSNFNVEDVKGFEVYIDKAYINNLEYLIIGDEWIEGYKYTPPTPTTTTTTITTTTTPKKPPLEIHLYEETVWSDDRVTMYAKAYVYENGEPAPNLTVYFYLPWNGTEAYTVKTDSNGVARLNLTDIIRTLYPAHPDLFYGKYARIVAVVSNGNYAAFDTDLISYWDVMDVLGWPIIYDSSTSRAYINANYGKIRFPVHLEDWIFQHEGLIYYNATWFLGILGAGENVTVNIPKNFIGRLYVSAMVTQWSAALDHVADNVPAYIRVTRLGSITGNDIDWWVSNPVSTNESIPLEGVVETPEGTAVSNAHVYADMVYEYTDGSILKDTYSYSNGSFKMVLPAANGTTYFKLNIIGVLPDGIVISEYGDGIRVIYGYISGGVTTTTTTTTTTTSTTSPTSTTTTTTATTTLTTSPTLVGGTLEIYENEDNSRTTTYLAIAIVAATMLIAGVISVRRRK